MKRIKVGDTVTWRGQEGMVREKVLRITKDDCGRKLLWVDPDFPIHAREVRRVKTKLSER
jgi:hypothetical protein